MRVLLSVLIGSLLAMDAGASCFPRNNKYIPEDAQVMSAVAKSAFVDAIAKVQTAYQPDAKAMNAVLQINNMWTDGTVNSQAYQQKKGSKLYLMVDAFGGLARYPGMTKDGYMAVLCHEVGHHFGKAPRYDNNTDWAAVEGQADYFATLRCMKKLGISSADASLVLAKVLADLGGEPVPARSHPDLSRVSQTYEDHPEAQCRLDTYDAGRACTATGALSNTNPATGTCHTYDKANNPVGAGNRPRCWFMPSKS